MPSAIGALIWTAMGAAASVSIGTIISIGLTVTSMVLAKRQAKVPEAEASRNMVTIKGGNEPQKLIYGEARVGGLMCFADTLDLRGWEDTGQSDLFMVTAVCPHHIHSYTDFFVNDKDLQWIQDNYEFVAGSGIDIDKVTLRWHRTMQDHFTWSGTVNGTVFTDVLYSDLAATITPLGFSVDWQTPEAISFKPTSQAVVWTAANDGEPVADGVDGFHFFAVWNEATKVFDTVSVQDRQINREGDYALWVEEEFDEVVKVHYMKPQVVYDYTDPDNYTETWYYFKFNGTTSVYDTFSRSLDPEQEYYDNTPLNFSSFSSYDGLLTRDCSIQRTHSIFSVDLYRGDKNQTASHLLTTYFPNKWTGDHRGIGVSYFGTHIFYDREQLPNGIPSYTAIVKGKDDLIDPRDVSTANRALDKQALRDIVGKYSTNAAVVILDYLLHPMGFNIESDEVDWDSFVIAANISDEPVYLVTQKVATLVSHETTPMGHSVTRVSVPNHGFNTGNMVEIDGDNTNSLFIEVEDTNIVKLLGYVDIQTSVTLDLFQRRYTINGVISSAIEPGGVLESLLAHAGYGQLTFDDGKYKLRVGAYEIPTVEITEDWIITDVQVHPRMSRDNLFNGVKGTYTAKSKKWQTTDFDPYANPTYCQEDNKFQVCNENDFIYQDVDYPFVLESMRCKRLAKLYLEKSRQALTVDLTCNLKAYELDVGDFVQLTMVDLGFVQKEFEVRRWSLTTDGTVELTLQETAAAIYDFNYGEYTTEDLAENTLLPQMTWPNQFKQINLSTIAYFDTGGVLREMIVVEVEMDKAYNYVTYADTEIEYRDINKADDEWKVASKGKSLLATIADVEMSHYAVRVRGNSKYAPPTQWYYADIITQGAGSIIELIDYPKPGNPLAMFSIFNNQVDKMRLSVDWNPPADKPDGYAPPEFLLFFYSTGEFANEIQMLNDNLVMKDIEIIEEGTYSVLNEEGLNSNEKIQIWPLASPANTGTDLAGQWWLRVEYADASKSTFSQVDYYDGNYVYLVDALARVPDVGDTVHWWRVAFHDTRDDRLGCIKDANDNYEIIKWDNLDYDDVNGWFEFTGAVRGSEDTTPIDATDKEFSYLPALGPGTSIKIIPASSFKSAGGATYQASYEADIQLPDTMNWGSMSCCFGRTAFKDGLPVLVRSPIVLMRYGGER